MERRERREQSSAGRVMDAYAILKDVESEYAIYLRLSRIYDLSATVPAIRQTTSTTASIRVDSSSSDRHTA